MVRLIYVSAHSNAFRLEDFADLQRTAAANNVRLGVTGLLLCSQNEFLQCLEGSSEGVSDIYRRIVKDPRHYDIRLLAFHAVSHPIFPSWHMMGLKTRPAKGAVHVPGTPFAGLDLRLGGSWRSLGVGAADILYEYAQVKAELERTRQTDPFFAGFLAANQDGSLGGGQGAS